METSASLSNIPNDIIRDILLQLPMKSLIRFQCVCKWWRSLIQDDSDFKLSYRGQERLLILSNESKGRRNRNRRLFVRSTSHDLSLQSHKWPLKEGCPLIRPRHEYFVTWCSCNGLVLLVVERDLLLWNPSTGCSMKVLERPYRFPDLYPKIILAGLCYDSCTTDYKAVLLLNGSNFGHSLVISSLNHKEWRPVEFPYCPDSIRDGVNFRNTFHWLVVSDYKYDDVGLGFSSSGNKIIYFDPVCDEFRILPTPDELRHFIISERRYGLRYGREKLIVGLGVIDDCICMAVLGEEYKIKTNKIQVLIMKEYGRQESWMTAFAIQLPEIPNRHIRSTLIFYSLKKDVQEVLFMHIVPGWYGLQVSVYDIKKDERKEVLTDFVTTTGRRYIVSTCFYVESLAWPGNSGLLSQ
ncbi:PREDICTED: F-box/kelch-repeat protein At3g23880-like [Ipomoea nil]|uniref:F-box/kelch-repeat protein At3g23880-like n=1 Tax=Ipomoea nil TaxID=35883 RepID=UPI00090132A8|nr:PREDICTED: F-box/kelch-repeat protein At3g23880-like [Ipomoea nil]